MSSTFNPSMPAPNPQIGSAANTSANLGQSWLNFAQGAYGTEQGMQSNINNVTGQATNSDASTAGAATGLGNAAGNVYANTVLPAEQQYTQAAENYGSTANQETLGSQAAATVAQTAASQQTAANQQMEAEGVNPNSGAFAGENKANALNTAVAEAGASTTAAQGAVTTGLGLESNAVGLGSTAASTATNEENTATNAATAGANTTDAANTQEIAGTSIEDAGYTGAEQGAANEGNMLQNEYNSQLQGTEFSDQLGAQEESSLLGGVGSLGGTLGAYILSSKEYKTNKRGATGGLDAMSKMPVGRWNYKPGIGDGGKSEHVGPYAEDFKRATGIGDGKTIPMQDALGLTMGAVNELAEKLKGVQATGLNQPVGAPAISKAKGTTPAKVHVANVKAAAPPKMPKAKLPQVKPQPRPTGLPPYRPLSRINPNNIKAA